MKEVRLRPCILPLKRAGQVVSRRAWTTPRRASASGLLWRAEQPPAGHTVARSHEGFVNLLADSAESADSSPYGEESAWSHDWLLYMRTRRVP